MRSIIDQIRKHGLYDEIWQAFVALLPMRTVGVMGDGRTYDYALRAARGDQRRRHDRRLLPLHPRFPGRDRHPDHQRGAGVNRVIYDSTSKPPGTIEWE